MNNQFNWTTKKIKFSETSESKILKSKLRQLGMQCGFALFKYGMKIKDFELMKKMHVAYGLNRIINEELKKACSIIYEAAEAHLAGAGQYGYSAEDLNKLKVHSSIR